MSNTKSSVAKILQVAVSVCRLQDGECDTEGGSVCLKVVGFVCGEEEGFERKSVLLLFSSVFSSFCAD
jgi:hypothetical protein